MKDILWLGYFGAETPEGIRYRNRVLGALGALVVLVPALAYLRLPWGAALVPGVAFAYIAWEWWRYLEHLDELGRRIQMEAMAFTYVIGTFLAMLLGGLWAVYHWNVPPALFILLELVRAWRVAVLARRYE